MMTEECGSFGDVPYLHKMPANMENDCLAACPLKRISPPLGKRRASDFCQDLAVPAIAGKLALPSRGCGRYIRRDASN